MPVNALKNLVKQPLIKNYDDAVKAGVDVDTPWYHGGKAGQITEIDPSKFGKVTNTPASQEAFFLVNNPKIARGFADNAGGDVHTFFYRPEGTKVINWKDYAGDVPIRSNNGQRLLAGWLMDAKEEGLAGLLIRGADDTVKAAGEKGGDVLAVVDPSRLRYPDAEFKNMSSRNTMAGVAGAVGAGSLLANQGAEAQEMPELNEKQRANLDRFQAIADRGLQDQLDPDKRSRFDALAQRGMIQVTETFQPKTQEKPAPDIFAGLPEETKQSILKRYPDIDEARALEQARWFGGEFEDDFAVRRDVRGRKDAQLRAANLERLKLYEPDLYERFSNMVPEDVDFEAIKGVIQKYSSGAKRAFTDMSPEEIADLQEKQERFEKLKLVRPRAAFTGLLADLVPYVAGGAATAGIKSAAMRIPATAAVEGGLSAGMTAGEGATPGEIAASGAIGAGLGMASEAIPAIRSKIDQRGQPRVEEIDLGDTPLPGSSSPLQPRKKADIRQAIQSGDKAGAGYKIDATGKVVDDPLQKKALKQGFSDTFVVKAPQLSPSSKRIARQMVDRAERALRIGSAEAARNPVTGPIGESVMKRFDLVKRANRQAGKEIKAAVENIKGKRVDVAEAVDGFADDLNDLGIGYKYTNKGLELEFKGSQIEGNTAVAAIKRVHDRLKTSDTVGNLQNVKQYIDSQINWNKSPDKPLDAKAVATLKKLREGINDKIRQLSPEYAAANDRYRETITGMNDIMDVMGNRFDPESDAVNSLVGQQLRKTLSNYGVGPDMLTAIDQLDSLAAKYNKGRPFDDDVIALTDLYSEMERRFGSFKPNSFQGVQEKAGENVARRALSGGAGGGMMAIADEAVGRAFTAMRGINEENAIKALRELLRD